MNNFPNLVILNPFTEQAFTAMESEAKSMIGDEVVISGISGIFPNSNSVLEFSENLYNKVDMVIVNHSFENSKIPELPKHMGKISGLEKFDAQFFRVSYWQVIDIDPLCRKLMEHTFSAIFDAGINPVTLAGKRIGVYAGSSFNDHFAKMMDSFSSKNLFTTVGSSMFANRISYWLDSKYPSYTVDFSCVSSTLCLEKAVNDIKLGFIDAAIVGSTNACNNPVLNYNLRKAGLLCLDGKIRCFDKNGDGYVRSEAVTSIFLQRAKDAKRIYAEICHVKNGYLMRQDSEFLPKREVEDVVNFIQTFYKEIKVSPKDVEYVEANGSGIVSADKNELDAIDRVFRSNGTVKVGSVKSNIGHTEAASGICSVIKMCFAYRSGIIPANLHYLEPIDNDALFDKRLQVVVENTLFDRGYTAINNFSFTGGHSHILLKGHYKPKDKDRYRTSIPYLVVASGREETSVNKILDLLSSHKVDVEQIALLHNIYEHNISGHTGRGYIILDNKGKITRSICRGFEYYSGGPRPIWFVYSGMGSQWPADLMKIPIFSKTIIRLQDILKPKGVDIIYILTTKDRKVFDNIINCFVAISAMQIGLTDILKELKIIPDYMIGHSLGEHGCAYGDGCLTAEEVILSSYYRGLVSIETEFIHGAMAAIGLGYEENLNIKTRIKTQSKFYILGYSFGVNIAIELAALMEKEGHAGIIFCLDSSPEAIPVYLDAYLGKLTNNELQNAIIEYVYKEVTGQYSQELKDALKFTENEQEKIEMCLLRLRSLSYCNEYVTSIIKYTYRRMLFAREYSPNFRLESEMVLLRGISHPNADISEDYGLSKYTKKPIQVFDIDSDHAMAPYNFQVANVINKMLDPELLKEFDKRNLCDTYLVM